MPQSTILRKKISPVRKSGFRSRRWNKNKVSNGVERPADIICRDFRLRLSQRTLLMGVLNRTPDSFSDGGMFMDRNHAVRHALKMAGEGADIIDIGGESTRPGASPVRVEEELDRTIPVIRKLAKSLEIPISIDTSKSEVAEEALKNGARIINDITGLKEDPRMAQVAAENNCPIVIMHIKGMPRTMQLDPKYEDLITEIIEGLKESIDIARTAGVEEEKIMIDPGIGFGKTAEHNLEILNNLERFKVLARPILIGVSRKAFIGKVLELEVDKRLMGTAASCALAITNGADIIRVHDVAEMRQVARMVDAILAA